MLRYDPALLDRFPATAAVAVEVTGAGNEASPASLAAAFGQEQAAVLERLAGRSLAEIPSIAAWRRTFSGFGVDPTKYRNATEALLRRLTKAGSIPSIGALVDLGNLVSIRHALPLLVVDADQVAGDLTVRFATGEERFDDLGGTDGDRPREGEVVFVDGEGAVAARRWCWRQGTASTVRPATRRALFVVEAQHEGGGRAVVEAAESVRALVAEHLPGARTDDGRALGRAAV